MGMFFDVFSLFSFAFWESLGDELIWMFLVFSLRKERKSKNMKIERLTRYITGSV
jgi:hypothetical protein